MLFPVIHLSQVHSLMSYTSTTQTKEHNGPNIKQHVQSSKVKGNLTMAHKGRAKRGLSSFVPFVNPQTRQNLASVINSGPQREQNILLLTFHQTLRLRLRLQEGKRWETLRSASRQLVKRHNTKNPQGLWELE